MPDFAYVAAPYVVCPECRQKLSLEGLVGFQWGFCRGRVPGESYKINDPIVWRLDRGGNIPAWTYFANGGGNIGDPTYKSLVVRESELGFRFCPKCGREFSGIAVHIENGIIESVRLHESGLPDAEISIARSDGSLTPMPEWDDHAMAVVDGGSTERLVPSD